MADVLISKSAVEKRRLARRSIVIGVIAGVLAFGIAPFGDWGKIVALVLVIYAIYKAFFKGLLRLWVYKE